MFLLRLTSTHTSRIRADYKFTNFKKDISQKTFRVFKNSVKEKFYTMVIYNKSQKLTAVIIAGFKSLKSALPLNNIVSRQCENTEVVGVKVKSMMTWA